MGHGEITDMLKFVDLNLSGVIFLFLVGFVGGLVSGFIGSGGAFVLTPGMMSLGVPGPVAVASNMCHKFPKALVGAIKRYRYGQVDVKLGLIIGISAEIGVQAGVQIQKMILARWGEAGANLYVSLAFVVVLISVGGFVYRDAIKMRKTGAEEKTTSLAKWVQSVNLWPMIYFPRSDIRVSFWFTAPLGFATGMLAATIAVGGFIGVPGMIYILGVTSLMASASELVIAFVMGLGGTLIWAWYGMVDIRLTLIILAGSLLGVQLGAIGTTFVKEYMIKYVMALIMLMVAVSRGLAVPGYLGQLKLISISPVIAGILSQISFVTMCLALLIGAIIILKALVQGIQLERAELESLHEGS
ncbi:MAG: sulfite exporter TauE/SafE family protein [Thermodesulfobacteriota bacterium]